ncbi:MAG: hypothetical protein WBK55_08225 [Alphaproteobacteria bacterium]
MQQVSEKNSWVPRAPRGWHDGPVFILGSGPSLDGFDYDQLDGENVIAVNDAGFEQFSNASILISTDERWIRNNSDQLTLFNGELIVFTEPCEHVIDRRARFMTRRREFGLSQQPHALHGLFTGVQSAINLAVHLACREIVLLGIDLKPDGQRKYTYGGTVTPRTIRQFANMKRALESTVAPLKRLGIDVLNASADSALECWPRTFPTHLQL